MTTSTHARYTGTVGGNRVSWDEGEVTPAGASDVVLGRRPTFERFRSVLNLSSEAAPPEVTFARSGGDIVLQVDDGLSAVVRAADAWPWRYDASGVRSIVLTRGHTNLVVDPDTPTSGNWSAGAGANRDVDVLDAPDGSGSGDAASCTASNIGIYQVIPTTLGAAHYASCWVTQGPGSPNPSSYQVMIQDQSGVVTLLFAGATVPSVFTRYAGSFVPGGALANTVFALVDGYNRGGPAALDRTSGVWCPQLAETDHDAPFVNGTAGQATITVPGTAVFGSDGYFDEEFESITFAASSNTMTGSPILLAAHSTSPQGDFYAYAYWDAGHWYVDITTPVGTYTADLTDATDPFNRTVTGARVWSRADSIGVTIPGVGTATTTGGRPIPIPATVDLLSDTTDSGRTVPGDIKGLVVARAATVCVSTIDCVARAAQRWDSVESDDRGDYVAGSALATWRFRTNAREFTYTYWSTASGAVTQNQTWWTTEATLPALRSLETPTVFGSEQTSAEMELLDDADGTIVEVYEGAQVTGSPNAGTWLVSISVPAGHHIELLHPQAPADRIVVYGDSIAAGYNVDPLNYGWIGSLRKNYFPGRVTMVGRSGWSLYRDVWLNGAADGSVTQLAAKLVRALDGTGSNTLWVEQAFNDWSGYPSVADGWTTGNGAGVAWTVAAFKTAYKALLTAVAAARPSALIYCAPTSVTSHTETNGNSETLAQFVAAISDAVTELANGNISFVDTSSGWYVVGDLPDGIHPNAAGHAAYYSALATLLGI